jgi:hypothetical protein
MLNKTNFRQLQCEYTDWTGMTRGFMTRYESSGSMTILFQAKAITCLHNFLHHAIQLPCVGIRLLIPRVTWPLAAALPMSCTTW